MVILIKTITLSIKSRLLGKQVGNKDQRQRSKCPTHGSCYCPGCGLG